MTNKINTTQNEEKNAKENNIPLSQQKSQEEEKENADDLDESFCVYKENYEKLLKEYNTVKDKLEEVKVNRKENGAVFDNNMKDIKYIKAKHEAEMNQKEKAYLTMNEDNSKTINSYLVKIKENELLIHTLNNQLKKSNDTKSAYANVMFKQEGMIRELVEKVNHQEEILINKTNELKESQTQLIAIIDNQKNEIIGLNNRPKDINQINIVSLQNKIHSLKGMIESMFTLFDSISI